MRKMKKRNCWLAIKEKEQVVNDVEGVRLGWWGKKLKKIEFFHIGSFNFLRIAWSNIVSKVLSKTLQSYLY